ncbi:MAG: type II toxin-antitoxin system HicB family antitoxin [Candidatus Latescibacteria bacterium]|jgi:predicted RNase H-like HicB family nuclease|nr:type II toxin-antitoxin system HicB family antitoxin [Candidatus Latescibacterota bacterium]
MKYTIIIEKTEKNYGAYVPDLPGCIAVAETRTELIKLIREAIKLHLESLSGSGETIPLPSATSELVEVGK